MSARSRAAHPAGSARVETPVEPAPDEPVVLPREEPAPQTPRVHTCVDCGSEDVRFTVGEGDAMREYCERCVPVNHPR